MAAPLRIAAIQSGSRIAGFVPPPRAHRHCCYGVLAPNAPMRAGVTVLAPLTINPAAPAVVEGDANTTPESKPRAVACYLWAMLLARIYDPFPLNCSNVD